MTNLESSRIEYKVQCDDNSDKLEITVVAFLNTLGGTLIYGIDDDGAVVGVNDPDEVQKKITNRILNNIKPNTLGLVDVYTEQRKDKTIIGINVSSGLDTPYYLTKVGRVPKGVYQRFGSTSRQVPEEQIDRMMRRRHINSLTATPSPKQDLTFKYMRAVYADTEIDFNENYMKTLEFFTPDGKYNLLAYLFADENNVSVSLGKWWGMDKGDLRENEEYGRCSIIRAMQKIIDKFDLENVTQARKVAMKPREEKKLVDKWSLNEVIKNAFAHNDYSNLDAPKFEIYSDKFEILSYGGLVSGLSKEEFFTGVSRPRSKEIMKIFQDLNFVDYRGSGVPKIVKKYGREIFNISENVIRTYLPFDRSLDEDEAKKRTFLYYAAGIQKLYYLSLKRPQFPQT